jgi:hypothetical protein
VKLREDHHLKKSRKINFIFLFIPDICLQYSYIDGM